MLSKDTRRKLSVHVTGAKEKSQQQEPATEADTSGRPAKPAATYDSSAAVNGASDKTNITMNGTVHSEVADDKVQLITDIWAFKRSQMLYPSVR